jgi:hypothetical protein
MAYAYDYWDNSFLPIPTPSPGTLVIPWISIQTTSITTAVITLGTPTQAPGSYAGSAVSTGTFNDPDFTFTTTSGVYVCEGLIPGAKYTVRARAYTGAGATGTYGPYITESFTMPKYNTLSGLTSTATTVLVPPGSTADAAGATSSSKSSSDVSLNNASLDSGADDSVQVQTVTGSSFATSGNRQVEKSLFRVTNNSLDPTAYSIATKNTGISTSYSHYSFGTGMFFQSSVTNVDASGGIGFFTDSIGKSGYYVLMQTTSNTSNNSDKTVRLLKVVNGRVIELNDSQKKNPANPLTGILGATSYKVDIKVKVSSGVRVIDVYINNFKISAIDTDSNTSTDPINKVLSVTSNVSMVATTGSAYYDYLYAVPLEESEYNSGILQNVYNGQFNDTVLNFLYGEKILSNFNKTSLKNGYLEEFGTVARELRKVNIKYESRPGYPLYPSLGINKFVNVLGSRLTSFGAEIYLINNAGTYVPLDDSSINSFSVIGNYLVTSGEHEYKDSTINEYTDPDPVVFESQWIQKESDAKSISNWIKNLWSKQQSVVTMQVFGNPLVSVGDVITINYPSNNLDGTKKFVVMNVTNSFNQGLETSITARTL